MVEQRFRWAIGDPTETMEAVSVVTCYAGGPWQRSLGGICHLHTSLMRRQLVIGQRNSLAQHAKPPTRRHHS